MASGEHEKRRVLARLKIRAAFNKKSPNGIQAMIDLNYVRAFCFGFDCLALGMNDSRREFYERS